MYFSVAVMTDENALVKFHQDGFQLPVGQRAHIKLEVFNSRVQMVKSESGQIFAIPAKRTVTAFCKNKFTLSGQSSVLLRYVTLMMFILADKRTEFCLLAT
jgi:hypothetical protein